MSNPIRIVLALVVVALVASVVLTMFGKPPNLPLGPLQGMLAGDDASQVPDASTSIPSVPDTSTTTPTCPIGQVPASSVSGGAAGTGTATTPGADATSTTTSTTPGATDTAGTGASAQDCVPDPNAGSGGTGTDTTTGTGGSTGLPGSGDQAGGGTSTLPGYGGTGGTSTGSSGGTGGTSSSVQKTSDGTNVGNNPEALRIAADVSNVMMQSKISVAVTASLVPSVGGSGPVASRKKYRASVSSAVLVVKLTDANSVQQWRNAGRRVQGQFVQSFLTRLAKNYPKAFRSVTVSDMNGGLLAIGDAAPGIKVGKVKTF